MKLESILSNYGRSVTIGVLGSHSALEICYGAKQEGLRTVAVCQRGRDATYAKYYKNLFDSIILLNKFSDIVKKENISKLLELHTVFIPNRSFSTYVGYDNIENKFTVPLFGNRRMLRAEERDARRNQYYLLEKAGIKTPKLFKSHKKIDSLCIVKVQEKKRKTERAFFLADSPESFVLRSTGLIKKGIISKESLAKARIEEFILGAHFNANFFWSPLTGELELLGFDRRIQTDLDGYLHMPAREQLSLGIPQNIEAGHMGATVRESQLEKIFQAGEKFIGACKREYPPGMIGLFALQGALTKELEFVVFDVSPRIPGCPCVEPTSPYMRYKYLKDVGPGRRVAMELKKAVSEGRLAEAVT